MPPKKVKSSDSGNSCFLHGLSILDETARMLDKTQPANVLRKLLFQHFGLSRVSIFLKQKDRKEIIDLMENQMIPFSDRFAFIKQIPEKFHKKPVYLRSEDGHSNWVIFAISDDEHLLMTMDDAPDWDTNTEGEISFLLKTWYSRKCAVDARNQQRRIEEQIAKVREIGDEFSQSYSVKDLLIRILQTCIDLVDAEKGHIMIYQEDRNELKLEVVAGLNPEADKAINEGLIPTAGIRTGEGIQGRVFSNSQSEIINTTTGEENVDIGDDFFSIICIPLSIKEKAYGVLYVTNKKNHLPFTQTDVDLVTILATKAASLIDQEKLLHMTNTDHLTKLYTRRYFEPKLEEELLRARRYERSLAVMALDVDFFKSINDNYGHQAGDEVLREIGKMLHHNIRHSLDVPARYGGEEFILLLPETDLKGAKQVGERILESARNAKIEFEGETIQFTMSIGLSFFPEHADNGQSLIQLADIALYYSKENGRDQMNIFNSKMDAPDAD